MNYAPDVVVVVWGYTINLHTIEQYQFSAVMLLCIQHLKHWGLRKLL